MNRFISAMPSSICWPFGENSQLNVDGMRSLLNVSASAFAREQAAAVDPGAEIGRDRDVRRGRDDARGERRVAARDFVEQRAKAGLRRHLRLDRDFQLGRHLDRGALQRRSPPRERHAVEKFPGCSLRRFVRPSNKSHSWPGRTFIAASECLHLRRRHQAGVIVLVAGKRQAETFDRVGDEADRPVVIDASKRFDDRGRSWPPRLFISRASSSSLRFRSAASPSP
jgi:hypothetical protein